MAAPPPRIPQKPGAAVPGRPSGEDAIQKAKREKDELEKATGRLEEELEELKAKYDQYFLGNERREPVRQRDELKKRVLKLKEAFTRNTGLKFRIQSLYARYLSYERLWMRSAREKEEGTYRRDLFKARLHAAQRGAAPVGPPAERADAEPAPAAPVAQPPAPAASADPRPVPPAPAASPPAPGARPAATPPPRPAAAASPPARPAAAVATPPPRPGGPVSQPASPAASAPGPARPAGPVAPRVPPAATPPPVPGSMNAAQMRALYDSYIAAKRSCNEDTSRLTFEAVARSVTKQIPELMTRFKAKSVDFKVEVKDGKAVLKAIPKV